MVGRRIEARGHVDPARIAASADPLAALDRLERPGGDLSFKGTLTGAQAPTEVERKIEELAEKKPEPKPEPKVEKKPEPKAEKAEPKAEGKDGKKKKRSDGESSDSGTRYTLQLSSFQDREEAEAFLASLRAAGFHAYVTEVDVGGKGMFYRVRHGAYRSAEAASDAKAELERVTRKTATLMRL
jgi:DedD protein